MHNKIKKICAHSKKMCSIRVFSIIFNKINIMLRMLLFLIVFC